MNERPPWQPLHPDHTLLVLKLETFRAISSEALVESLRPNQPGSLKVRNDGTIVDGHHRIKVLRERNVDVDQLPREIIPRVNEREL